MGISTSIRKQLFATTILVATGSIYGGYGRRAMAGTCATTDSPPAHLNISCSGATNPADVTQSFTSAGGFTIVDVAGFGLDTSATGGNGLETDGGTTDITITGDIHAQETGIDANVTTAGATTEITNSGSITSDNRYGIFVTADDDTGNVTITNGEDATIQADDEGIDAFVRGEDAITTITNSGSITSDTDEGIYVTADDDTGNVTITNEVGATIQADDEGIEARVNGTDAITTITNSGSITSDTDEGIYVNADNDTGNVTITNGEDATIQASEDGIDAVVRGEDAITTITNSGSITSNIRDGIFVRTVNYTGNVTITNGEDATIRAVNHGIYAYVKGEDAITTITNSGSITSYTDEGIFVTTDEDTGNVTITNGEDATIQAYYDYDGINARVRGTDAITTITNSGEITSYGSRGIYVSADNDTGNVTITNGEDATIQAYDEGIDAVVRGEDAITTITNSGSITSDNDYSIYVFTDDDTGNVMITNGEDATIQAYYNGINARVYGTDAITTITNSGSITSDNSNGIDVNTDEDTGNVTITNGEDATIQADDDGIDASVRGEDAITTITNSGSITSANGQGIFVTADEDTGNVMITNGEDATIQADSSGIYAYVRGEDAITEITNSGSITSVNGKGIDVYTDNDTGNVTITNEVGATIQADDNGIDARVHGTDAITTITNSGEITSNNGRGIYVYTDEDTSDVTITNGEDATIQADDEGIYAHVYGAGAITEITNSGMITSDNGKGIDVFADGYTGNVTITNEVGATIQADDNGIDAIVVGEDAITEITNSGSITSDGNRGIDVFADDDTGNVTITNGEDATIQADNNGINADVRGEDAITTITNSGSITSDTDEGIDVFADDDTGNVTITNEVGATIQADDDGIYAYVNNSATTTITTSGTITSNNGNGIRFYSYSSAQTATVNINVNETITASAGAGVDLYTYYNDSDLTATVNIDADINADTGVAIGIGDMSEVAVNIKSGASVIGTSMGIEDGASKSGGISAQTTVTLEGELGGNVDLGGNDDSFTMKGADASLTAATTLIDGGDGTDDFNFDNVQTAAMSTFSTALNNFETIELKNGSFIRLDGQTWVADDVIINGGNTLEALGTSTITGDLANSGTVKLTDGAVDEVFTIDGDLSGSGTFALDANLNASETSDQVVVTGDVMGSHNLSITNLSGGGVDTGMGDTDGILVVDVSGTATAASFSLTSGPVYSGAYVYDLHMSAGNDFYLQSMEGMMSSSAALVPSLARGSTLGADALMVGYLIRQSSRVEAPINLETSDDDRDNDEDSSSFGADILHASEVDPTNKYWLRLLGAHGEYEGRVDVGGMSQITDTDTDFGGVQLGIDFALTNYPATYASLWGHYLHQENDVYNKTQAADAGNSTISSYGVGLGITYDPGTGLYFDALGSVSFSSADLKDAAGISGDTRGSEYFASAEIGYRMQTGYGNLMFIPQAQIKTHIADFDGYTDSTGLRVSNMDSHRSTLRLGVSAENTYQMSNGNLRLVGGVSWSDVFSSETRADLAAVQVDLSDADQFIEGDLGFEYTMDNGSSIWGSINHKSGLDSLDSENTSFDLGFSVKF